MFRPLATLDECRQKLKVGGFCKEQNHRACTVVASQKQPQERCARSAPTQHTASPTSTHMRCISVSTTAVLYARRILQFHHEHGELRRLTTVQRYTPMPL
eukprot:scpid74272/ scgid8349/ 